jgi:hypothetical protein
MIDLDLIGRLELCVAHNKLKTGPLVGSVYRLH